MDEYGVSDEASLVSGHFLSTNRLGQSEKADFSFYNTKKIVELRFCRIFDSFRKEFFRVGGSVDSMRRIYCSFEGVRRRGRAEAHGRQRTHIGACERGAAEQGAGVVRGRLWAARQRQRHSLSIFSLDRLGHFNPSQTAKRMSKSSVKYKVALEFWKMLKWNNF